MSASSSPSLSAALLRTVGEAILLINENGLVTAVNPTAEKLFVRAVAEARGRPAALDVFNAELARWLIQAQRNTAPQPTTFEIELFERQFAATLVPLADESSAITGWLLALRDVTHLRQAEQWRGEAVQSAAHDLRTPLNLMAGSVNLLAETLPNPTPDQAECLTMLRLGMERMNTLTDQLLSLERAQGEQSRQPVSLRAVLHSATAEFQRAAAEKNIQLAFEGETSAAVVLGDVHWLQRAVDNLLNNALKYTPAGGRITVRYRETDGQAIAEVADTGLGVPPEAQAHLFERFYRVKSAATRHIPGTGLGLAIVKAVIEQYGGRVWVSSVEGQGSTFGFSLPLIGP